MNNVDNQNMLNIFNARYFFLRCTVGELEPKSKTEYICPAPLGEWQQKDLTGLLFLRKKIPCRIFSNLNIYLPWTTH